MSQKMPHNDALFIQSCATKAASIEAQQQERNHEQDLCQCGDYRRDHVDGTGKCKMPNDMTHGFKPCMKFRLASPFTFKAESAQEVLRLDEELQ